MAIIADALKNDKKIHLNPPSWIIGLSNYPVME
jgi:hypothetical protein